MYLRSIVDPSPQLEAEHRAQEIIRRNKEIRQEVGHLRRQLVELEKEAERLGLIEDLVKMSENGSKKGGKFKISSLEDSNTRETK